MKGDPILLLDFDGVIHSYIHPWKGARVILDPPVKGALEFIIKALDVFDVQIYSSRSNQFGGRRAMRKWLFHEYFNLCGDSYENTPGWLRAYISQSAFADPWIDECKYAIKKLITKEIKFPKRKPAGFVTIDDRAIQFRGEFPDVYELVEFVPWNKRGI